jgi:hypothetical protein
MHTDDPTKRMTLDQDAQQEWPQLLATARCIETDVLRALYEAMTESLWAPSRARGDPLASRGEELSAPRRRTQGMMWSVVSGSSYCEITQRGTCVTDGADNYGNDERCTVRAEVAMIVSAQSFSTEADYELTDVQITGCTATATGSSGSVGGGDVQQWERRCEQ